MSETLYSNMYNPDVLSCLANLSNDEVLTPPQVVNDMLDMLPQELFRSPDTTFLDPATKSGIFLREIAKRLIEGLKDQIPDLQMRVDHIFHHQIFGIAITELTSLLARRSVYCSKFPNAAYSVTKFADASGNIRFKHIQHRWSNGKCVYCGASQSEYDRDAAMETHAYEWIHTTKQEDIFKMKFDVIIGNPPYQLNDGGGDGNSAAPIYHHFIMQSKKLKPRFISMIIPARWYSGGKGLDDFRNEMLNDDRLAIIHDFPETGDCFPGLNIRGGVCYFLWQREHRGECSIYNHKKDSVSISTRPLLEKKTDTFIRYNAAISILRKVRALGEETMDNRVSSRLPFGIPSNFVDFALKPDNKNSVILYRSERGNSKSSNKRVFVSQRLILKNIEWKDKMKVLVSKASPGGDEYPHSIITAPILAEPNSVCTETYLIVDFVENDLQGNNLISYMNTRFFRFMMALIKNTQNISKGVFAFVPVQDISRTWTDEELYAKYSLTEDEIAFIESMIRPMGMTGGDDDGE